MMMNLIASYPTTSGPRQLISVLVPDADYEHSFSLLDIDANTATAEIEACDAVVVDDDLASFEEAHHVAIEYMIAALRADGPATRCDVFDADLAEAAAPEEELDPLDYLPAIIHNN
jgi:hypothetical protein